MLLRSWKLERFVGGLSWSCTDVGHVNVSSVVDIINGRELLPEDM